jgi:glycine dehydrogenase subunit 1
MRYLPLTDADRRVMLGAIGAASIEALFKDVPPSARLDAPIAGLPLHQPEHAVEKTLAQMAARNLTGGSVPFFLGAGAYRHHVPAAVDHLIQRGEFLTSYTPYQPEVSQGTLQYLFEFQTQVALLTGMDVANASMYDGSTACAEAVAMANRVTRRNKAVLSARLHPHYRAIVETNARLTGFTAVSPALADAAADLLALVDDETSCLVVQYPDFFGDISDLTPLAEAVHAKGALLIVVVTEIVSLGLLTPPGEMGADIVVAEGQSIGNPLNFGGPYVGLFATREKFVRQMPGRLCGETIDADGKRGWVLTLSTREQHIRREKATSNICTNAGLCALAFTIHLSLLGDAGLARLARLNHERAIEAAEALAAVPGVRVLNTAYFNEFTIELAAPAAPLVETLAARGILAGVPVARLLPQEPGVDRQLLVAVSELTTSTDIAQLCEGLKEGLSAWA